MKRFAVFAAAVSALTVSIASGQEDARRPGPEGGRTVPIISDLPLLGTFFGRGPRLWYPLGSATDFRGPDIRPGSKAREKAEAGPTFRERWLAAEIKRRFAAAREVHVLEKRTTRWTGGERQVEAERGLEIVAAADEHAPIKAFLDRCTASAGRQIRFEVAIVTGAPPAPGPVETGASAIPLSEPEHMALMRSIEAGASTVVGSPEIIAHNGQLASVSLVNETTYVRDYEVEIAGGATIADPVVDEITEGFVVDLAAMIDPDNGRLHVEASVVVADLARPIQTMTTTLEAAGGREVTIQLPEVTYSRWQSDGLVLDRDQVAFRVTGLARVEDGRQVPLDVIVRVIPRENGTGDGAAATLIGVDHDARRLFARLDHPGLRRGGELEVVRSGAAVGRARILEVEGRIIVLELLDGEARRGDGLR